MKHCKISSRGLASMNGSVVDFTVYPQAVLDVIDRQLAEFGFQIEMIETGNEDIAWRIKRVATGKLAAAVEMGAMGGKARAANTSAKRRREIARLGARTRWGK